MVKKCNYFLFFKFFFFRLGLPLDIFCTEKRKIWFQEEKLMPWVTILKSFQNWANSFFLIIWATRSLFHSYHGNTVPIISQFDWEFLHLIWDEISGAGTGGGRIGWIRKTNISWKTRKFLLCLIYTKRQQRKFLEFVGVFFLIMYILFVMKQKKLLIKI